MIICDHCHDSYCKVCAASNICVCACSFCSKIPEDIDENMCFCPIEPISPSRFSHADARVKIEGDVKEECDVRCNVFTTPPRKTRLLTDDEAVRINSEKLKRDRDAAMRVVQRDHPALRSPCATTTTTWVFCIPSPVRPPPRSPGYVSRSRSNRRLKALRREEKRKARVRRMEMKKREYDWE